MTNDDRDMLLSLRRQQADLQQVLERLTAQLGALEARWGRGASDVVLPPIPPEAFLPPIPTQAEELVLPPIPATPVEAALPPLPPIPTATPSMESHFGRWLLRLGAGFLVFSLILLASWAIHEPIGAAGKLGLIGLASVVVLVIGQRFVSGTGGQRFFGWILLGAGLASLYFTFYAAHYDQALRVIPSPLLAGFLLLLWSFYVLLLAEKRKLQALGVVGMTMAYFSTSLNPYGAFTMGADLILTATAAAYLMRFGWTTLAAVSAFGTYFALLRRLTFDPYGDLVLDTSRILPFWPHAVYLIGAWTIYTAAIILTTSPTFRGGKRLAFLSLNNAGLAFLLGLTAYIAGYGVQDIGWTLFDTGLVFLVVSRFAGFAEVDPVDLMGAYAAQGLALFTTGVIVVFTGITRAIVLLIETLLLGIAGAFAGDRILLISTYVAGFFATIFSIWQVGFYAHHPWLLGLGGALIMLINAWSSRGEVRHSPVARSSTVLSTTCFCLLGLGLIFTALSSELSDAALPPALAISALLLTFAIYQVSIFELPSLAQFLQLAALGMVLFPIETGEELPGWSIGLVGLVTLVLLTWWARQRTTLPGPWIRTLLYIYALALVYLAVLTVRPYLGAQGWMVAASLLSAVFLIYGALARVWPVAIAGQVLLLLSLHHFFFPPQNGVFPWAWWAAAVPVMVTFCTARAAHSWLRLFTEIPDSKRAVVDAVAYGYKLVALAGVIRWVFALVPESEQMAAFLFLGTLLVSMNVRHFDSFGVRCSFLLSATGMFLCLGHQVDIITFLNAFAVVLFLAQVPLISHDGRTLVTRFESWVLVLAAAGTGWFYVSAWAALRSSGHMTMAWALTALFLFVFGLLTRESRLRFCGLAILFAAILRVFCVDLWGLSGGFRVLTFFLLAIITLGVGLSLLWRDQRNPTPPENSPKNV